MARAYIDQLKRNNALSDAMLADLSAALDSAAMPLQNGSRDKALATRIKKLAATLNDKSAGANTLRQRAGLSETLKGIAARLR